MLPGDRGEDDKHYIVTSSVGASLCGPGRSDELDGHCSTWADAHVLLLELKSQSTCLSASELALDVQYIYLLNVESI